jgi:hypothetical protein
VGIYARLIDPASPSATPRQAGRRDVPLPKACRGRKVAEKCYQEKGKRPLLFYYSLLFPIIRFPIIQEKGKRPLLFPYYFLLFDGTP